MEALRKLRSGRIATSSARASGGIQLDLVAASSRGSSLKFFVLEGDGGFMMDWMELRVLLLQVCGLWVLWEVGRALRASTQPHDEIALKQTMQDFKKLRRHFKRIDARLANFASASRRQHAETESERFH
jgi:hypothetical protein